MKSPADLLFEGLGRGISRVAAAADPDLPELLRESEGRTLALVVRGTDRILEMEVQGGSLRILPPRRLAARAVGDEARTAPPPASTGERGTVDAPPASAAGGRGPDPGRDGGHDENASGGEGTDLLADHATLALEGSVPDFVRFLLAIRRDPLPEDPFVGLEVRGSAAARQAFVEPLRRIDPDYESLLARAAGGVVAHALARTTVGRLLQARRSAERLVDDLTEYLEEESRLVPDAAARTRLTGGVEALRAKVAELEGRLDRASRRN